MTGSVIARRAALQGARAAAQMSVRQVEAESGVSRSTVSNLCTRAGYGVSRAMAERIAATLNRPVSDLFVHHDGAPLLQGDE